MNTYFVPNSRADRFVVRKSDGALFEASCSDDYGAADAFADCLSGKESYYFRRIESVPLKWWQRTPRWKRTGEIWECKNGREFEMFIRTKPPLS